MASQRLFIEHIEGQVERAKELVLPILMLEYPAEAWSSTSLQALQARQETLEPLLSEALGVLCEYELPFLQKEESLLAAGISLETDLLSFEEEMLEFERSFWNEKFQASQGADAAVSVPDYDLCARHGLTKALVKRAIIAHDLRDFEDVVPLVAADSKCGRCRLGITRLLTEVITAAKATTQQTLS